MTDRYFNELKKASKNKPSFQYLDKGEWKVCDDLAKLPYQDTTLGNYLNDLETSYNSKIEGLEKELKKQNEIITNLVDAIKKLNGGV